MSANGIDRDDKGKEDDVISINLSFSSISNPGRWSDPVFTDEEVEEPPETKLAYILRTTKQTYIRRHLNEDDSDNSDNEDDEDLHHPSGGDSNIRLADDAMLNSDGEDYMDDEYSNNDDVNTSDDDDDANAATVSKQRTMTNIRRRLNEDDSDDSDDEDDEDFHHPSSGDSNILLADDYMGDE